MLGSRAARGKKPKEALENIHRLKHLGVDSVLQVEIMAHLAEGSGAAWHLASKIFRSGNNDPPSRAQYMKVLRALAGLEREGYVSRSLFGKERPYRLTRHGQELMNAIVGGQEPSSLISRNDLILYASAASSAWVSLILTGMELSSILLMGCWLASGILTGLCIGALGRTLRRIW